MGAGADGQRPPLTSSGSFAPRYSAIIMRCITGSVAGHQDHLAGGQGFEDAGAGQLPQRLRSGRVCRTSRFVAAGAVLFEKLCAALAFAWAMASDAASRIHANFFIA